LLSHLADCIQYDYEDERNLLPLTHF
jgi:hypothetical protein